MSKWVAFQVKKMGDVRLQIWDIFISFNQLVLFFLLYILSSILLIFMF